MAFAAVTVTRMAAQARELGAFVRCQLAGRAFASVDVGAMDPLAKGGRVQVEICGDPRNTAVANLAEAHGFGLEFRGEGAAWPLGDGLCLLVHGYSERALSLILVSTKVKQAQAH